MNDSHHPLSCIRMVMIGTTLPANIGSAARAMHTMGLGDLWVISPRLPIDDTSRANAAGATCVLDDAVISDDVQQALADCTLVFAASARSRHMPRPVITPYQAAHIAHSHHQQHAHHGKPCRIAVLFGREDRGLTNDELALADYHIQIPANPDYPVLNVASSMQVIASALYDVMIHTHNSTDSTDSTDSTNNELDLSIRRQWDEPAITHAQKQQLQQHIIKLMITLELAQDGDLKHLPNRLSRLSSRLQLDQKEFALLQSVIAKINRKLNAP